MTTPRHLNGLVSMSVMGHGRGALLGAALLSSVKQLMRVFLCMLAICSASVASAAEHHCHAGHCDGHGKAAAPIFPKGEHPALEHLPAGELRDRLAELAPAARARALATMASGQVGTHDLPHLRVDITGGVFFECDRKVPDLEPHEQEAANATVSAAESSSVWDDGFTPSGNVSISSPPVFNSNLGSTNVVYLDFNGDTVVDTGWNDSPELDVINARPYNRDSEGFDPNVFEPAEQNDIYRTWQQVAEDLAPYDINVTTDPYYDVEENRGPTIGHIVFTHGDDVDRTSAGVAYLDVFGKDYYTHYQPAWVFYNGNGENHSWMADTASHEFGHNIGLAHDGDSANEYYPGHDGWGTIMGGAWYARLSQWSNGEYYDANQLQDDQAILVSKLGNRPDDHGNTIASSSALKVDGGTTINSQRPENGGIVTNTDDVDMLSFSTGAGAITLRVDAFDGPYDYPIAPANLDVGLRLLDAGGSVIAVADPVETLWAEISTTVAGGTYYLEVRGVGVGDPMSKDPTGYVARHSVGQFFVSGTVIASAQNEPPTAVISATPTSGTGPLDVSFSAAGSSDSDGSIVSYRWDFGTGSGSSKTAPSHLYDDGPGVYTATLTVTDDGGAQDTASVTITVEEDSGPNAAVSINFQPADAPTVSGYLVDAGDAFGSRGNGQSYGWNTDVFQTRDRNRIDDQLLDTLNHAQYRGNTYSWELAVANGDYEVVLSCGDSAHANMLQDWVIEGQTVYDLDGLDNFDVFTVTVSVTDGRLTLVPAATAENAKINYVEVRPSTGPGSDIWLEDFADLSDGVQRDSGETAWQTDVSDLGTSAYFGVSSGTFRANRTGGVGLWKTEQIDITGQSNVQVSVDIQSQGPMESRDYIEVSYRIDGGSEVMVARRTNNFNGDKVETVSAAVGSGTSVQVIIRAKNSASDETHVWDNISVSASGGEGGDAVLVNFQPVDAPTVDGYLVDAGDAFGNRGNGQSYGWNVDNFRTRDRGRLDDQLLDTLNHAQYRSNTYTWELAVPNGDYEVVLTCSDPRHANMIHDWDIEGQRINDPDGLDSLDVFTVPVSVTDGRLTLTPAATAENAKISVVEVRPVASAL